MKAWVLQMLILHADAPPTVEYFDTRVQCEHRLGDWASRTIRSHPTEQATLQYIVIEHLPEKYSSISVGRFFAVCVATDKLPHRPWENTSP